MAIGVVTNASRMSCSLVVVVGGGPELICRAPGGHPIRPRMSAVRPGDGRRAGRLVW